MKSKERLEMAFRITDNALKDFTKHDATIADCLTVLGVVCEDIIELVCGDTGEDYGRMMTTFCNGLQLTVKDERHYTTGDEYNDNIIRNVLDETKAGGSVKKIVDKYFDALPEYMRNVLVDRIENAKKNGWFDNITIGYEN